MINIPIEGTALSSIESSNVWHMARARLTAEGKFIADIYFDSDDTVLDCQPAPLAFYLMCRLISYLLTTSKIPNYTRFNSIWKNLHSYLDVSMHVLHVDDDFCHPTFIIEVTLADLERAFEKYETSKKIVVSKRTGATLVLV